MKGIHANRGIRVKYPDYIYVSDVNIVFYLKLYTFLHFLKNKITYKNDFSNVTFCK